LINPSSKRPLMPPNLPPAERTGPSVQAMFATIARRYDLANHLLSGGLDFLWRRRATEMVHDWDPRRILDLATGSGDLALAMTRACPDALLIGADFCPPMLQMARRKGLKTLIVADALQLPFAEAVFDVVTVAFGLRNMASWEKALAEMRRVLRPGGHVLILDFSVPPAPLRWFYRPYLHSVLPHLAGWLTGEKGAYEYLGQSIEQFPHGPAMCTLLEGLGFRETVHEPLSGGIVGLYAATRR